MSRRAHRNRMLGSAETLPSETLPSLRVHQTSPLMPSARLATTDLHASVPRVVPLQKGLTLHALPTNAAHDWKSSMICTKKLLRTRFAGINARECPTFRSGRETRISLAKGRLMPPSLKHARESCNPESAAQRRRNGGADLCRFVA